MSEVRKTIVDEFSKWTVLSSFRRGPIRSRKEVYELLSDLEYATLMDGPEINETEFMSWHRKNTKLIKEKCKEKFGKELAIGWGVKMINMYLKTKVYIAKEKCRNGLNEVIHPPIDGELIRSLKRNFKKDKEIMYHFRHIEGIKDIDLYDTYKNIVQGLKLISQKENCSLIEVEKFWRSNDKSK